MTENRTQFPPIPALVRAARGAYSRSIRKRLHAVDCADLPANGAYVVGGLNLGVSAGQLFREMGFSPAARERLIAQLIEHGFVERGSGASQFATPDLATTEKGHIAAHAVREGIEDVNVQLANKLTPDELSTFVAGLMALIEIKEESEDHDRAS